MATEMRQRKSGKTKESSKLQEKIDDKCTTNNLQENAKLESFISKWFNLGFGWDDFKSFDSVVRAAHRPADPSGLAVFRIAFGCLMVFDCIHERGLSHIFYKWGDVDVCQFPLFNFLQVLPLEWMVFIYIVMGLGALGIALGFLLRLSCLMFIIPYWYVFMLEKSNWNNHSYLFGLTATMLMFTDANRYWSIDALLFKSKANASVPVWNYGLIRFQIFLVYFLAGLKKLDKDWVQGYSMAMLGYQWVFDPFRTFLSNDTIDKYIVHIGGLVQDLIAGFLLYFDGTRPVGALLVTSFHIMNSRMFKIGQFPYVMLCTTLIFFYGDWPKRVFPKFMQSNTRLQYSPHCLEKGTKNKTRLYHKLATVFFLTWMSWQAFMPYSHCITRGYNGWKGGLYGYSWDMMVHNIATQHIKIKFISKDTGEVGFLNPEIFVGDNRWASHPDMIKQHVMCVKHILETEMETFNVELYYDIWLSLNRRLQQRTVDPRVDLVGAEWNPFKDAKWFLPLLNSLDEWRESLSELQTEAYKEHFTKFFDMPDVTFVADFPGMMLENYIDEDLKRTSITLLHGTASIQDASSNKNQTLTLNEPFYVTPGTHKVYVTSEEPACYMYTYSNSTHGNLEKELISIENKIVLDETTIDDLKQEAKQNDTIRRVLDMKQARDKKQEEADREKNKTYWQTNVMDKIETTYLMFSDSFWMGYHALESIVTGTPMEAVMTTHYGDEDEEYEDVEK